jgi:hypothetical protein
LNALTLPRTFDRIFALLISVLHFTAGGLGSVTGNSDSVSAFQIRHICVGIETKL